MRSFSTGQVWPDIKRFVAGMPAYPTPDQPSDWALSEGFWLAYLTGHPDEMQTYIDQLDHDAGRLLGGYRYGLDNRWFPGQWAASAEPMAWAAIEKADLLASHGETDQAIQILEAALPEAESALTSTHLSDRATKLRWRQRYESGDEVDLFEYGLNGWILTRGQFEELPQGQGVIGKFRSNQNGPGLRMICGLDPGPAFEAELGLTLPPGFRGWTYGGVGLMLEPTIGLGSLRERMITIRRNLNDALIWLQDPNHPDDDDRSFGTETKQELVEVTLRIQKWGKRVRLWVNDRLIIDEYEFFGDWPGNNQFAIAAFQSDIDLDYVFHRFRIKKLSVSPFGDETDEQDDVDLIEVPPTVPSVPPVSNTEPPRSKRPPYAR